jgi:hypothetical protein
MKFEEAEEEVGFGDESEGGMLTQSGSIRAFTVDNRTKAKVGKKMQARLGQISGLRTSLGKETPSGLQSSLSFTPLQGIELVNPSLNDAVMGRRWLRRLIIMVSRGGRLLRLERSRRSCCRPQFRGGNTGIV